MLDDFDNSVKTYNVSHPSTPPQCSRTFTRSLKGLNLNISERGGLLLIFDRAWGWSMYKGRSNNRSRRDISSSPVLAASEATMGPTVRQ